MALQLDVLIESAVYSLTAGTPFRLERAEGLGMAPVRRLGESGPYQNGETDLGYRLDPRVVTLALNFAGTTDAAVDTARSLLAQIAQPVESSTVTLRVTRNDGEMRYLDCYAIGDLDFPLVQADKSAKLVRTVLQLRAANPVWYRAGTEQVALDAQWYLAGGSISSSNVMEVVEYITTGQQWTYSGTPSSGWTIVFRSGTVSPSNSGKWAYGVLQSSYNAFFRTNNPNYEWSPGLLASTLMTAGTNNYMQVYNASTGTVTAYRNGPNALGSAAGTTLFAPGTARYWARDPRLGTSSSDDWPVPIIKGVVYDIALGTAQLQALHESMTLRPQNLLNVIYSGNVDEYPVLYLTGNGTAPVITNAATNSTITFGTTMVTSSGTALIIDLRPGVKTVTYASTNRVADVTDPNDLLAWKIVPTASGTNTITVTGGTYTVDATYYHRYVSY